MTPWEAYRAENPMLAEMTEYNTRVRDRVALKKARIPTSPRPQDEVQDRTDGPEAFASARLDKTKKKAKVEVEFTDRYKALGIPYPKKETMCLGQCEGTGLVPIYGKNYIDPRTNACRPAEELGQSSQDEAYQKLWDEAEAREATDDGWHFIKCLDCGGTGLRKQAEESLTSCIKDLRNLVG